MYDNKMLELLNIKESYRKKELQIRITVCFICPTCKIKHSVTFVVNPNISNEQLENFIDGEKQRYYYDHVLDCNGEIRK